ncbi:unnamed protein product [Linum tenue]|uniref:Uncharacterized protein n=1 Tax=Linum tenue TaxID=586396 RepID=A0AAV0L1E5_9ROSI|nr:unnamed protein product [Linum tenue]
MEQCRQGKSAKWIRNLGKRIGSEGWARGSLSRTRRLSADCSSCFRGESGSPRAGRGTDWERPSRGPSPGVEQPTQNWRGDAPPFGPKAVRRADPGGRHCQVGSLAGAAHLLKDNAESGLAPTRASAARLPTSSRSPPAPKGTCRRSSPRADESDGPP